MNEKENAVKKKGNGCQGEEKERRKRLCVFERETPAFLKKKGNKGRSNKKHKRRRLTG